MEEKADDEWFARPASQGGRSVRRVRFGVLPLMSVSEENRIAVLMLITDDAEVRLSWMHG